MIRKLYHGAAWYPELWDENVLDQEIALMQEAGINIVRMGECESGSGCGLRFGSGGLLLWVLEGSSLMALS